MAQTRQKLMVGALVVIFAGYAFDQLYQYGYERPMLLAERQRTQLEQTLRKNKLEIRKKQARLDDLQSVQKRSLPRNLELGISAYRNWLLQTLGESGLEQANLDSGTPTPVRNIYYRIDFSLRTQGTLTQVTQFLHRFYGTNCLHKMRSVSLTPLSNGSVDVAIAIETLTLATATSGGNFQELEGQRPVAPLNDFQMIARRNVFRAGDPLVAQIAVSAITTDAQKQRQAWLSFPGNEPTRIVEEGDTLSLDGSQVQIVKVTADQVQIQLDGENRELRVGETLR